jgi:hypothetical protein
LRAFRLALCASSPCNGLERTEKSEQTGGLRTWLTSLCALLFAVPGAAEAPGMKAELSCRTEAAPGRVLCELKYTAKAGARLVWADALVTSAPEFVKPLRARIPPERFKGAGAAAGERKLILAFVAAKAGVGQVVVKARAVVCRGEGERESCRPETQDVRTEIRVGR